MEIAGTAIPIQLTNLNYHSNEVNRHYMSNSQYKDFMECEAMAMAKINGEWREEPNDAMLVGSYVHAAFDGTLEDFKLEHPEMLTQKGELKAAFKQADEMISVLQNDEFAQFVLDGLHEHIIIAEFAGALWKAKLDVYTPEQRIVDIKTARNIHEKYWDKDFGWVTFAEKFGYLRQMSIYAELVRIVTNAAHWLEPLIVAVTKEDPPDKEIIGLDIMRIEYEIELVKAQMPRILLVKSGEEEPKRCEKCRYCRTTKKLQKVMFYGDLIEG